jgi:hypothetical protein
MLGDAIFGEAISEAILALWSFLPKSINFSSSAQESTVGN